MIPLDKLELIKTTATDNIVEIIGDFVELKKRGSLYIGLSPFANERTPSFTIHQAKGIFKDFSSGKGGDVLKFLMLSQEWNFMDAIKYIGKRFGIDIENNDFVFTPKPKSIKKEIPTDFIHPNDLLETTNNFLSDNLYKFLCLKFDDKSVHKAFEKYYVGTSLGWTIFWQIDIDTFVRSGKFIKYLDNGHRDKESKATWQHSKTKEYKPVYPEFNLQQCFFGEHLLTSKKPVAIVESEKTAIIASLFIEKYIWLSCGSKNGLNDKKCEVLKNRSVTLFPDLGCYNEWKALANKYNFSVSDILEKKANDTDRVNGYDLADYLL